ncbi:SdrD B-like domain-containing protein, partial [Dyadobacter sp. CY312]|uniref:SdrD B-like domain-containing protein n=1 Tax=Dyadobacter sp. CY312 TaxID=2907303 RepID=UPI001F284B54
QESNVMTIPATQAMNFTVTPVVEKICNDGLNSIQYHAVNNTGGTLTYKLYSGTDATGTLISTLATPANVPSGTYYYEIVRPSSEGECPSAIRSGIINISAWQTNPTITRSLALNCQPLGSGPQATGQALLQFSGFGPFVVERSIDGGPFEVVDPAAVSSYSESSLEAGKVYTYRVTDQCGKSVSQQVMIKPLSPRLTSNTQEPCNGTDYTLSAIDFGDPLTTYKWEKDGVVLANTREYTLTNFQPANNGVYKLTVSLLNGCIVRETYITLNSANCGDPFATGSLGNKVWYDTNSDGIQAATGEAGVPNVPVTLQGYVGPNQASPSAADLANNAYWAEVDNKTTDANGEYLFGGLETGYYRVKFGTVPNYGFTTPNAGADDAADSDAGTGGFSGPVFINSQGVGIDKDNPTVDAGLVPAGSIGDYVWTDEDHDGIQDTDEDPKAGVTVKLYVKNGSVWGEVATTVTGTDGKYLFSGLPAGTYQVEFTLPGGMVFTNPNVVSASDDEDSDADMVTGKTGEIIIDPSQAETSVLRNNMSIDAGITTALPVKLSMFDVKKGENVSALLRWTTTEEVNSDSFEIQRSADAKSWNAIGQVKAKENNVGLVNYRFDDMQPNLGANYYRLKMIDLDGSFAYSSIRKLSGDMGAELTIYPNPVSNELSIQSTTGQAIGKVELINQSGKVVLTKNGSSIASPINVKNLPAGIYLVKISFQNGTSENRKVIIVR